MPTGTSSSSTGRRARGAADLGSVRRVSIKRLTDDVAGQIRDLIVTEDLKVGTRLPSERDLAEMFGTSRPTASQALRTLSLMGLVEIKPGSGSYVVREPDRIITASVNLMLDLDHESLNHLVNLRFWLESLGVREAVRHALDQDLERVRVNLVRLRESVGATSPWLAADTVFHASLVRASGNPYLGSIYESIHTAVLSYEYEPWVRHDTVPAWLHAREVDVQMALHAPILDAIEARDEPAALAAVELHHEAMVDHVASRRGR